mmetsp:Transcript_25207/g.72544  ORF Transcript_25207/g.72544 Transcript_25207/m.72544 type:complete len:304 (-) Transcript_25207:215-1126(-)
MQSAHPCARKRPASAGGSTSPPPPLRLSATSSPPLPPPPPPPRLPARIAALSRALSVATKTGELPAEARHRITLTAPSTVMRRSVVGTVPGRKAVPAAPSPRRRWTPSKGESPKSSLRRASTAAASQADGAKSARSRQPRVGAAELPCPGGKTGRGGGRRRGGPAVPSPPFSAGRVALSPTALIHGVLPTTRTHRAEGIASALIGPPHRWTFSPSSAAASARVIRQSMAVPPLRPAPRPAGALLAPSSGGGEKKRERSCGEAQSTSSTRRWCAAVRSRYAISRKRSPKPRQCELVCGITGRQV